ncbi:MAG: M20/M25/M40 family metallo-hydrolase, partial [Aestuariivirga sp.]
QWETRLVPGADFEFAPKRMKAMASKLEPAMKAIDPETGIATTKTNEVPGLAPEQGSEAERMALHAAGANATHAVSYCTEAGLFQAIGIPAVICGPGNIEQAHKPDEFVSLAQLELCEKFLLRLAEAS